MTTATRARTDATPVVPESIESPQAKLVYVYLAQERNATVDDLADALGLRKLGLFDVIATLEADGHVECHDAERVSVTT
ncbi:TrmB family transcriptional regulator [Halorubellus salinus]|uniref:TrmB family transcriptional regulator n=1 Tax=Halorubellus salinus TaxID=755309 RepID=UPI001D064F71|nr:TrmB family transcriptional regulator [Halorubellus salinus]